MSDTQLEERRTSALAQEVRKTLQDSEAVIAQAREAREQLAKAQPHREAGEQPQAG